LARFDAWDKAGIWAFHLETLRRAFTAGDGTKAKASADRALLKALAAHEKAGIVLRVARGLYVNPRARSLPADVLSTLVTFLRPWDTNYLSLESALSEAGRISQIPSRLTVMTTGRSQTFETPYGTIEFVHTARKLEKFRDDLVFDARRELYVARPNLAARDLRRVGRNVDLLIDGDDAA